MQNELWSSLLADLQALGIAHQSAHWRSSGDAYYGDHQLYERMYGDIATEIDQVAERLLGLTGEDTLLDPMRLLTNACIALKTIVTAGDAASSMLVAEKAFLKQLAGVIEALEVAGCLSDGSENLLQAIADKHEEHVYLLSRRAGVEVLKVCVKEAIDDVHRSTTSGPAVIGTGYKEKNNAMRRQMLRQVASHYVPNEREMTSDLLSDIRALRQKRIEATSKK